MGRREGVWEGGREGVMRECTRMRVDLTKVSEGHSHLAERGLEGCRRWVMVVVMGGG